MRLRAWLLPTSGAAAVERVEIRRRAEIVEFIRCRRREREQVEASHRTRTAFALAHPIKYVHCRRCREAVANKSAVRMGTTVIAPRYAECVLVLARPVGGGPA